MGKDVKLVEMYGLNCLLLLHQKFALKNQNHLTKRRKNKRKRNLKWNFFNFVNTNKKNVPKKITKKFVMVIFHSKLKKVSLMDVNTNSVCLLKTRSVFPIIAFLHLFWLNIHLKYQKLLLHLNSLKVALLENLWVFHGLHQKTMVVLQS